MVDILNTAVAASLQQPSFCTLNTFLYRLFDEFRAVVPAGCNVGIINGVMNINIFSNGPTK